MRELKRYFKERGVAHSRRTPPGVRELKHQTRDDAGRLYRRTPPGVRELKQLVVGLRDVLAESHPSRGA